MASARGMSSFFRSFAGRIIVGGILIHLVLIPFLFSGVLYIVAQGNKEQFINYVRNDAHQLAEHLAEQSSLEHLRNYLDETVFSGRAVYADVILDNSTVLSAAGNQPQLIKDFTEDFYFGDKQDHVYNIALSFPVAALQMPATLRLSYDEAPTQQQIKQAYQRGMVLATAYILLSLLLVAVVIPQLTRPLRRLRDAAQKIAGGGVTEHLRVHSGTREIAAMAVHETVGRHSDGHSFAMEMAISELPRAEGVLFIAIMRDITERKQAEAELKALQEDLERRVVTRTRELAALNRELEHQALHDGLSELPNRLLLQDRLRQAILGAQRKHQQLALLITDLDRFKEINDTLGHHYGDLVLQQVAGRMRSALRESDTIARLGGDEFAILLPQVPNEMDAINAARKLITALEQPIHLEDQSFHIVASVGIALYPEHGEDGATLMLHADVAMYVAKRSAAGFSLYDPKEDEHSVSRLALVGELRQAIEQRQLVLFYQPKIDLKHGHVAAVEAVVRWNHPQRGLLLPDEFIPLAEQTGLIRPLTFYVLDEALHQVHLWQKVGLNVRMAINLSARHLQDEHLAGKIADTMRQWGVVPELLEFEITESALMANPLRAMETLTQLDEMGVGLAIDDFGTGYSSLIYLKQLPVDEIK